MQQSIKHLLTGVSLTALLALGACGESEPAAPDAGDPQAEAPAHPAPSFWVSDEAKARADIYVPYTLTADLSHLSDNQRTMVGLLIDASKIMDDLFWLQAYGDNSDTPNFGGDPFLREFFTENYGPWDRLDGDKPFLLGYGEKPLGANFYPADMTKEEFEAFDHPDKAGLYSIIERDADGGLVVVPYHEKFAEQLAAAAVLLREAATHAADAEFKEYLLLRADAITSDNYQPSDFAWMDMKNNPIELVLGAIETYEDQLYGYRTAYESYVLVKDLEWSERLAKYAAFLPELQRGLPVDDAYKAEVPGSDSDLNAYEVVYYAGHSNAGSKTIAINLPNDEEVQLAKGTRRLQLKNAMRAKFDKILMPIADELIAEDQRQHVTFNAFFSNVMFHEVAHGLGIKETLTGKGPVRTALKETSSALEEGKADILGLYMVKSLFEKGEITEGTMMDYYVTFMAGIFRSSRFGASSAHGRANMIRFNHFKEMGAFARGEDGMYRIDFDRFTEAMNSMSELLLKLQGDGDYEGAKVLLAEKGVVSDVLAADLARLNEAKIPVDVKFTQGRDVLGL